jgi:NarL family two-component system response regulator LiaR
VRYALEAYIRQAQDMELVGQAREGREAVQLCDELLPDVIIMDMVMPHMNGVEAIQIIHRKHPQIGIIAITSFEDEHLVQSAIQAGATSFLQKNITMNELHDAIRKTDQGKRILSPEAAQALVSMSSTQPIDFKLTERERDVLSFMAIGLSNPQIASQLCISRTTVASHVGSILEKLKVKSRTEAVAMALKNHFLNS